MSTEHNVHCQYFTDFKKDHVVSQINTPIWLVVYRKIKGGGKIASGLGSLSSLVIAENKPEAARILKLFWKELTLEILDVCWIEETKWNDKFIYWCTYK